MSLLKIVFSFGNAKIVKIG